MTSPARAVALLLLAGTVLIGRPRLWHVQFEGREVVGRFYRVEAPATADRVFTELRLDRVAPHALALPAPIAPLRTGAGLRGLLGGLIELPDPGRLYVTALDARGAARALEVDLLRREVRQLDSPPGGLPPYAVELLVAPDASKIYVQWYRRDQPSRTDIYDGASLSWLGSTREFLPDSRAAGFHSEAPYLWTLDPAGRAVRVDTNSDGVEQVFDPARWLGPVRAVVSDAWRELLLIRTDVGHDRYRTVDVVSGEIGPPLDLPGYAQAQPRLALDGRMLVLIEMERRPARFQRRQTAIATGAGTIYDLRTGASLEEFRLVVPHDLPVAAVGATSDPALAGRLWLHVPGDQLRLDFDIPGCRRGTPAGGAAVTAQVDALWDPNGDPLRYRYRVRVTPTSEAAVGAVAVQAGRATQRTARPDGWGVDLVARERWVRWTNGLGPPAEDVAPGSAREGFVLEARESTRPGIGEYRVQAATGLPRGCESDGRFLENSVTGHTIVPGRVDDTDVEALAERLQALVERACAIEWVAPEHCPDLRAVAGSVATQPTPAVVGDFLQALTGTGTSNPGRLVLDDAAQAVREALEGARP